MSQKLIMHHMGPVNDCTIELKDCNILTGPQSQGKSTIAKAVYFFRTVKQVIVDTIHMGGLEKVSEDANNAHWISFLRRRLKENFLNIFGTSWVLPDDMTMRYEYSSERIYIEVKLTPDTNHIGRNYVNFNFSPDIEDFLNELDYRCFTGLSQKEIRKEEERIFTFFNDPFEVFYIPAGRSVITVLSDHLPFLFASLGTVGVRTIDQLTRNFSTMIMKLKPSLKDGLEGFLHVLQEDDEYRVGYSQTKTAIKYILERANLIVQGKYRYVDDEERIYLPNSNTKYIKINFASSGQQEVVWLINLLVYYLAINKRVFLIVEEPESHLYPESQRLMAEVLSLFRNTVNSDTHKCMNNLLITTHSPYILGSMNYMLMAGQCSNAVNEDIKKEINKRLWFRKTDLAAWFVKGGYVENGLNVSDELTLIKNELIDGASEEVNRLTDYILEQEENNADEES